jgi:hypothetical protein
MVILVGGGLTIVMLVGGGAKGLDGPVLLQVCLRIGPVGLVGLRVLSSCLMFFFRGQKLSMDKCPSSNLLAYTQLKQQMGQLHWRF